MRIFSIIRSSACVFLLFLGYASPAIAGPYADTLGKAIVSNTTPEEKVLLVRWMFAALSVHPGVKNYVSITDQQRAEITKSVAKMFERLLTVTCVNEAREAIKYEGPSALTSSFQLFGQVAARELMGNPSVAASLSDFDKYIDSENLKKVLELDSGK